MASRTVPQVPLIKQLAFLFRRVARLMEDDPVDVTHGGFRLRLHSRGNISESTFLFMPARWDRDERRLLDSHLSSGAIFVDVGANAGGYIWFVLRLLGDRCRVLAVEPDPDLRARLRFNLETNSIRNVRVTGVAVGPKGGEGWLRIDETNRGQNVLTRGQSTAGDGKHPRRIRVPVRPLPDLLEEEGIKRIDALKIDVEGLEASILEDFFERAPEPLWPRLLLIEWRNTAEYQALEDHLEKLGYRTALRTRLNRGLRREVPGPTARAPGSVPEG